MKSIQRAFCISSSSGSEALLRGRTLFLGESKTRRGVWGAQPTRSFMGREISLPLLARTENTQPNYSDTNEQTKGTKMNKPKSRLNLLTPKNPNSCLLILVCLSLPLFSTACSSTCHKRELALRVLDEQSELLRRVKVERQAEQVSKKVQADPALSTAESHLQQAIESMLDANASVKTIF